MTNPVLIIVIGVSGCGKSTLAALLAKKLSFQFLEADDFHSDLNKQHMASGKPLTDAMREPWIVSMLDHLQNTFTHKTNCVLAYSGLRKAHRLRFSQLPYSVLFLHLTGSKELILTRTKTRSGHFMPPELLDSQIDAFESTDEEDNIIELNLDQTPETITEDALSRIESFIAAL